jgi:hypothetical protein
LRADEVQFRMLGCSDVCVGKKTETQVFFHKKALAAIEVYLVVRGVGALRCITPSSHGPVMTVGTMLPQS